MHHPSAARGAQGAALALALLGIAGCPGRGLYVRPEAARGATTEAAAGGAPALPAGAVSGAGPLARIHAVYRLARLSGYQDVGSPELDNLKDGREVQTVLLRRTRWRLREAPQSLQQALRRRAELLRLPPEARSRYMDRIVDHAQIWWLEGAAARRATPRTAAVFRPASRSHRHYREVAFLGRDETTAWFAYAPIPTWVRWQKHLGLRHGADPAEALVRGLAVRDAGAWTAFSCFELLSDLGPRALPAVRAAIQRRLPQRGSAIRAVGRHPDKTLGPFLRRLATHADPKVAGAARRALLEVPRKSAGELYLAWLAADAGKKPVLRVLRAIEAIRLRRAVPLLQRVLARPESVAEYLLAFRLSRQWLGPPLPAELAAAAGAIQRAGIGSGGRAADPARIRAATARLLALPDREAVAVAALRLALFVTKGDARAVRQAGVSLLQRIPGGAGRKLLRHLAQTLYGTDLLKIQKLATVVRGLPSRP